MVLQHAAIHAVGDRAHLARLAGRSDAPVRHHGAVPHIVDPEPWLRQRIAEETAPLRKELATATSWSERTRVRLRIWRASARLRRTLGAHGPVRW